MTKFEEFTMRRNAVYFQTKTASVGASSAGAGWFVFVPFMKIVKILTIPYWLAKSSQLVSALDKNVSFQY